MVNWLQRYLASILVLIPVAGFSQLKFTPDSLKVQQLNVKEKADAFPWLSADGLRLYFTAERPGLAENTIYFAARTSIDSPFTTSRRLSSNFKLDFRGATLTSDEKTIYLRHNDDTYVSTRNSRDEEFPEPVIVEELDKGIGPAISPDGREIVIRSSGFEQNRIYRKNQEGKFVLADSLPLPAKYRSAPGQYSKDGLSFYASLERMSGKETKTDTSILVRYRRSSLDQPFKNYEILLVESTCPCLKQVTVNDDETIMIGVKTNYDWKLNELTSMQIREMTL